MASLNRVRDTGGNALKVDIINGAYSRLRISGITRAPTPEDLELALCRLEDMAAEWDTVSAAVGYNFSDSPDPNDELGVIRGFKTAYESNLATRLISDFNKAVPPSLFAEAGSTWSNLLARVAADRMRQVPYPTRQPIGSGNSYRYSRWARFYRVANDEVTADVTMYEGDVRDFVEHFDNFIPDGDDLDSVSIVVDDGLTVTSQATSNDDFEYRITADDEGTHQVTIIGTTVDGLIDTRIKFIQVLET